MGCERLFAASDHPLPLIPFRAEGDFWIGESDFPEDVCIRRLFTKPHIYYLGSHMGCGCGFDYSAYQMGDYALWRKAEDGRGLTEAQLQEVWEKCHGDTTDEEWKESRQYYEAGRRSVQQLRDYLAHATESGSVELYVRWGHKTVKRPKRRMIVTPAYFDGLSFSLNAIHEALLSVQGIITKSDVEKGVIEAACDHMQADPAHFTLESDVVKDLGADSLDYDETILAVEDAFAVQLPDRFWTENTDSIMTFGLLSDYIWNCLKTPYAR